MASLRSRLIVQYSVAIVATVLLLAGAVFTARRSTALRTAADLAGMRADIATLILRRDRPDVSVRASRGNKPVNDSAQSKAAEQKTPFAQANTRELLDRLPGILVAFTEEGDVIYQSPDVIRLAEADTAALNRAIRRLEASEASTYIRTTIAGQGMVMVVRRDAWQSRRSWIFAAMSVSPTRAALEMLGSVLLVLPLIVALGFYGAYRIGNQAVKPLESITAEVRAISDGRSLHRRLPVTSDADEHARLTTQLNSMIERLETSFGALRRFTADASHELKTPLAVLRADVERAMHANVESTEHFVALEEALQETKRMATLVDSLLTLARADEGRFDLHREPVQLEEVVRDVFETATILGEEAELTVTLPVVQPAVVQGDRTRLRQLLLNLVTNAIKYTPRGGSVELSLVSSDAEATITVRDTGIGIAAADLPFIFDRFYRADRARSRLDERGGFGLGLSISQWIAQAHGGTLTVQSRLHRGSTFVVTLPLETAVSDEARDVAFDTPRATATA